MTTLKERKFMDIANMRKWKLNFERLFYSCFIKFLRVSIR